MIAFGDLEEFRNFILKYSTKKAELKSVPLREFLWGLALLDVKTKQRESVIINISEKNNELVVVKRNGKLFRIGLDRLAQGYCLADGRQCGKPVPKKRRKPNGIGNR